MSLFFVRHGESEANILHEISNRGYKHPLTDKGRQQAGLLASQLMGCAPARIYTSPLLRAVQTAEILAQALHAPISISNALREYDCGMLEGKTDPESWAAHRRVFDDWMLRGLWNNRIDGGESFLDIESRFTPLIRRLVGSGEAREKDLILVGHAGTYHCMLPRLLINISFDFSLHHFIENTASIQAEERPEGLFCLEWCGFKMSENATQ